MFYVQLPCFPPSTAAEAACQAPGFLPTAIGVLPLKVSHFQYLRVEVAASFESVSLSVSDPAAPCEVAVEPLIPHDYLRSV